MSEAGRFVHGHALNAAHYFAGRNGRLAPGLAVHAIEYAEWIDGAEAPVPACHVGTHGWQPWRIEATAAAVSCRRCLQLADPNRHPPPQQLVLFDLGFEIGTAVGAGA